MRAFGALNGDFSGGKLYLVLPCLQKCNVTWCSVYVHSVFCTCLYEFFRKKILRSFFVDRMLHLPLFGQLICSPVHRSVGPSQSSLFIALLPLPIHARLRLRKILFNPLNCFKHMFSCVYGGLFIASLAFVQFFSFFYNIDYPPTATRAAAHLGLFVIF